MEQTDLMEALLDRVKSLIPHCHVTVDWVLGSIRVRPSENQAWRPWGEIHIQGDQLTFIRHKAAISFDKFEFCLSNEQDLKRFFEVVESSYEVDSWWRVDSGHYMADGQPRQPRPARLRS